jgi:capsular polysaccharide biosynthesis protein
MVGVGIVTGLLAAGVAYGVSTVMPKSYETQAVVFFGSQTETNPVVHQANQDLAADWAVLAITETVLVPVIEQLSLDETVAELRERVIVRNPEGLRTLDILTTSRDGQAAADLANTIADEIVRQTPPEVAPASPAPVSPAPSGEAPPSPAPASPAPSAQPGSIAWVADRAPVPSVASSPRPTINGLLGGVVGFVLGMGIAWLFTTRPSEI